MSSSSAQAVQVIERRQKVLEVLRRYVDRRSAGEDVSDAEIIDEHRDLMPELGRELRSLGSSADETLLELSLTESSADNYALRAPQHRIASLPGYEQLEEIKAGGQGVVYKATQVSTGQKVAIKAIQGGPLAGRDARARLLRETRILGSLRHPNVVRVYDSGTMHGSIFYVMEYIAGRQLDAHLSHVTPPLAAVVDLFTQICDGVNAAHLLGVIHRDLKPSNVLIDPDGNPRIVDFGLAKIAMAGTTESDLTEANAFLGTARYAAPEQCARDTLAIDTRTDVYALGVMLFEAIAGEMPYDTSGRRESLLKRIQDEPARDLRRVAGHVPVDLAAIVARCLRKDPAERYQNAGELARDLRRFQAGEPIDAKRDHLGYVLLKRAGRYRWHVGAAAALLLLGIGQAAFANYMWSAVQGQRDSARAVTDLLVDTIQGLDPSQTGGSVQTPLHAELAATVRDVEEQLPGLANRESAARVQAALGHVHLALGDEVAALQQLEPAATTLAELYGPDNPETLAADHDRAFARKLQGRYVEAESIYRDVLERRRAALGSDHLDVAATLNNLGQLYARQRDHEQAISYLREALQLREDGEAPPRELASSMANLGSLLRDRARALRVSYEETPDEDLLAQRQELLAEAGDLLTRASELRQAIFTQPHLHIANSLNKLGLLQRELGLLERDRQQPEAARAALQDALENLAASLRMKRLVLPGDHWELPVGQVNLGMTRNNVGDFAAAADDLEAAFEHFLALGHRPGLRATLEELVIARRALGNLELVLPRFAAVQQAELATADDAGAFREWLTRRTDEVAAELP